VGEERRVELCFAHSDMIGRCCANEKKGRGRASVSWVSSQEIQEKEAMRGPLWMRAHPAGIHFDRGGRRQDRKGGRK